MKASYLLFSAASLVLFGCHSLETSKTKEAMLLPILSVDYELEPSDRQLLFHAIEEDDSGWVEHILKAENPSVNYRTRSNPAPLEMALRSGNAETIKILLRFGADPYAFDQFGYNALTYAALIGDVALIEVLLAADVNPNRLDGNEMTALMVAASGPPGEAGSWMSSRRHSPGFRKRIAPYDEIIRRLLASGADTEITNSFGLTAVTLARNAGHATAIDLFLHARK